MRLRSKGRFVCLSAMLIFFAAASGRAQDPTPKKRLRAPATVRGLIGGESIDHYVIRARKGQTITITFTWKKEENNTASFSVSSAAATGPQLDGQESDGGKRWTGKIPRTGDYLIEVVAHPYAHYTLRVRLRSHRAKG